MKAEWPAKLKGIRENTEYHIAGNVGGHEIVQICQGRHWAGFKFGGFRVPDPNDVTKWRLHLNLSLLLAVSVAGPFSAVYLPVFALSSGV